LTRRSFIQSAAAGLSTALLAHPSPCGAAETPLKQRPNIVLILADDLGYGDLSCYGAAKIATPKLDRLASEGVHFTDAHSPCTVCAPTRYGILTGRYFWRSKQKGDYSYNFHDGETLLPQLLREAGYATAAFGKWHNGFCDSAPDWNKELKPGPIEAGFDYYFGTPRTHNEPPFVFVENHFVVGLDPDDPLIIVPKEETPKGQGWGWGISKGAQAAHEARPEDQIDIILTEKAVTYIDSRDANRPFFLYLPYLAPHVPLSPSQKFRGTSEAGVYGDYIEELDWCVGEVLDALERNGMAQNTLVILTSDNGAMYHRSALDRGHRPNAHLLGQKTDAWEGGHRVPFIARWPEHIPAGTVSDNLLSLTDLFATAATAAGVVVPDAAAEDSLDQLEVMLQPTKAAPVREEMVYHGIFGLALRSGDWVYLPKQGSLGFTAHPTTPWGVPYALMGLENSDLDPEGNLLPDAPPAQLYNVRKDPAQKVNRYREEPTVIERLSRRLTELTGGRA
jgi:arylsulfatase A